MENALGKKLKIKEGDTVVLINAPKNFQAELKPLPKGTIVTDKPEKSSLILLFIHNRVELEKYLLKVIKQLLPDGVLWFCFPKGTSGIQTDLTRDKGWGSVMQLNLTWLSLISVNEQWSGFAIRNKPSVEKPKSQKQQEANKEIEKYVDVVNKTVSLPPFIAKALSANKKALKVYEGLAYSHRKEYIIWILEAKQDETRQKRLKGMLDKLNTGLKNPWDK